MKIVVCDWRDNKGEPCGERADITVTFTQDGKRYEADLCSQIHGKQLAANAREAESPILNPGYTTTKLPKAGAQSLESKVKEWALAKGGDTAASINQRGRQPRALKEQFLSSPEGIVWQKNNS